jgi:hypothetical protein
MQPGGGSRYARVIFGPHPSCFGLTYYELSIEVTAGNHSFEFEPYFTPVDSVTGYRQSEIFFVGVTDSIEYSFRYEDKNPQFTCSGTVLVPTEGGQITNIYISPDTINSCVHYGICGDYESLYIIEAMSCSGADSIFVTWIYSERD